MLGERLRSLREQRGLTQAALAQQAGVSRQLVGAVEAGRHLPRIDAAVALARALQTTVEALLSADAAPVGVLDEPDEGSLVRLARVGNRQVCAPVVTDSLPVADGRVVAGGLELFEPARPAMVVAGCDPAIGLTARLVEQRTPSGVVPVAASTASALAALAAGRVHAGVVHGRTDDLPAPPAAVQRWAIARWQVGLAAPAGMPRGWAAKALAGRTPVVQREVGAQSQAAFVRAASAAGHDGAAPGPQATGHLDAARRAAEGGMVAVTIEPSSLLLGMEFHPLEQHVSELWVAAAHAAATEVVHFLDMLTDRAVRQRLEAVGGYDLADLGRRIPT